MIEFKNVSKTFGPHTVLENINLNIGPGEFISITGPSGAGKSTLINMLIGKDFPSTGEVVIDGIHLVTMDKMKQQLFRRNIGIIFQDYKLLPNKTVYENVSYALEVCGTDELTIEKRVPKILDLVGLLSRQQQYPKEISGGEQQRTAIARALVHNPNLLIADEPTGNLDKHTAKDIIDLLLQINAAGTTIVLTTHNDNILSYVKKRIVVLDKGKITMDKVHGK